MADLVTDRVANQDRPALAAVHPLAGLDRRIGSVRLRAIDDRALVSLACSADAREALSRRCAERLGVALPQIGCRSKYRGSIVLLALQRDQTWCVFARPSTGADRDSVRESGRMSEGDPIREPADELAVRLGPQAPARLTDQSDGWVTLELGGIDAPAVLERLCPLDLDPDVFDHEAVARTSMEHMAVVIQRSADNGFELMSPTSTAASLLHAIETVALHIANEQALQELPPPAT